MAAIHRTIGLPKIMSEAPSLAGRHLANDHIGDVCGHCKLGSSNEEGCVHLLLHPCIDSANHDAYENSRTVNLHLLTSALNGPGVVVEPYRTHNKDTHQP